MDSLADYYARRAAEYERIYAKPERQADLAALRSRIAGLFAGLPGIILGPFVGAVIGELTTNRDLKQAGRAGVAAWIGFAIGTAVKVGIVFLMIGMFLAALVF